jgi:hypothetical protein
MNCFEFSLSMIGFDLYLIKSHKQIPIEPQRVLAKKHTHYASARKSSNQIQIKLQVLQISSWIKFWFRQSSNFKRHHENPYNNLIVDPT